MPVRSLLSTVQKIKGSGVWYRLEDDSPPRKFYLYQCQDREGNRIWYANLHAGETHVKGVRLGLLSRIEAWAEARHRTRKLAYSATTEQVLDTVTNP